MNYVLIDDEIKGRSVIKKMLQIVAPEYTLIGEADSVSCGIKLLKGLNPDVLFLDIQMEDGTGFDLLNELSSLDFHLIFTTAYDSYALKAFKFNAVDYILKPIDMDELSVALNKVNKYSQENVSSNLSQIKELIKEEINKRDEPQIAITDRNSIHFIKVSNILRCEASSNYTEVYLEDGSRMVSSKTLKEFDLQLEEYNFFRIHNSHLVNLRKVSSLDKNGYIVMMDNSKVEVSRRKKTDLLHRIHKL